MKSVYQNWRMNERGVASLLTVAILSLIIVTSLATVHIYLENRAKHHGRIRKAYQATFVMEDLSKLVYNALENYAYQANNGSPNTCPAGSTKAALPQASSQAGTTIYGCFPSCGGVASFCVKDSYGASVCLGGASDPCATAGPTPTSSLFEMSDSLIAALSHFNPLWDTAEAQTSPSAGDQQSSSSVSMKVPPDCSGSGVTDSLCQKCDSNNCPTIQVCTMVGSKSVCSTQIIRLDPAALATPSPSSPGGNG